jgi:hypothetical protein
VQSESAQKRRRLNTMLDNLEARGTSNSGKTDASDTMAMALMHEVQNREADREERRVADSKRNLNNFALKMRRKNDVMRESVKNKDVKRRESVKNEDMKRSESVKNEDVRRREKNIPGKGSSGNKSSKTEKNKKDIVNIRRTCRLSS